MASSLIGSLRVALGLDTAQFESGAQKARQHARSLNSDLTNSFNGAKRAIEGLFAAFTVGLLTEQIKKSLDYAGSLAEVSRTLGLTTKDLQTFRFAASQTGVAQDQLEVGLRRLTVSMGKAELGSAAQTKAFAAIGISIEQLKGKTTGDVFRLMADGLSKVTDRAQRAAIEMTLMGRSGSTLDNLLAPGSARLNELAQAAQQLGVVLSDSQIQNAEQTAHKLAAVKEVLSAQIAGVVSSNAGAILSLSSALATLTGQIVRFLGSNPELALGIVGALLGGRVGGLPGAVIGGAGGALLGLKVGQSAADQNTDLGFRTQAMRAAQRDYLAALGSGGGGPAMGVAGQQVAGGAPDVTGTRDEFIRQIGLLKNATAQSRANGAPKTSGANLPQFLGGGGGGGGAAARKPRDNNEQDAFQFDQAMRQQDLQILDAKKQLSHDYVEQTTLSIQMLDVQKAIVDAEIDHKVAQAQRDQAEGKITPATLAQIVAESAIAKQKEATLDHLKRQAVLDAEAEQRAKDTAHFTDLDFDLQKQKLQAEANLAETAKERRDLELRLLDLTYAQERARQEAILADQQATDAEKEEARRRIVALNGQFGIDRQGVIQQTRGPLDQYLASLPTSAAKWTEALQQVAVDGFGEISNAADTLAGKIVKVGGIFGSITRTILADLLKIELEKMVIAPLANALGGLFGGGGLIPGGSGSFTITGTGSGVSPGVVKGYATGGSMTLAGNPGVDRNLLSLNGVPIARVSRGEQLDIGGKDGGGRIVVNQTIAPNFAGNAPTRDEVLQIAVLTKQAAVDAVRELQRRKS